MIELQWRDRRTIPLTLYSGAAAQGVVWILGEGWFRPRAKLFTALRRAK